MKKLLVILLSLICIASSAQVKTEYNQYGGLWKKFALRWNGAFQLPRSPVSSKDLNVPIIDSGQMYYNPTDSSVYYNTGTGSPWIKIVSVNDATAFNDLVDVSFPYPVKTGMLPYYKSGSDWVGRQAAYKDTGVIVLSGIDTLRGIGDSWWLGSFSNDVTKIFPKRVADSLGLPYKNQGVNAAGWYRGVQTIFSNNLYNPARTDLVVIGGTAADAISNDNTKPALNKLYGLTQVAIANLFLKSAIPMSDASVTKSGFSNSSVTSVTKSAAIGGTVQAASATNSTASFTATIAAGESVVIGTFSSVAGTVIGDFQVDLSIGNGLASDRYVNFNGSEKYAGTNTNGSGYVPSAESGLTHYPSVIIFRGLTAGSITFTITTNSNTATYIDYWGILAAPDSCKPVIVPTAAHLDVGINPNYGLPNSRPYHNEVVDAMNEVVTDVILDYFSDYPISNPDVNKYFIPPQHLRHPDNIHPDALTGDVALAQAVLDGIRYKQFTYGTAKGMKPIAKSPITYDYNLHTWGLDTSIVATQFDISGLSGAPTLQQVTDVGDSTLDRIRADAFSSTNPSAGYSFNLRISDDRLFATGWAGFLHQNTSNGRISLSASFHGQIGELPSFTSPAITIDSVGKVFFPNYNGPTSHTGTPVADLRVTSSGDVITGPSTKSKGFTIESPSASENVGMWKTPVAITVSSLAAVLVGSSSPSVTFQIAFGTDRTSGTNVFSSGQTATSTTTGHTFNSSFNDATIPAGSFIWVTTSAQSGTVTQIELTINYTED